MRSSIHYKIKNYTNHAQHRRVLPLIKVACSGQGFIDPEIEARILETRKKDREVPRDLYESNEQIADRMGFQEIANNLRIPLLFSGIIFMPAPINLNGMGE